MPFDRGAELPGASIPWSYLFLHVVRLTLQLLDHPVELGDLALVVPQVITELAPAAVELLQLLHRKRMMSVHPNRPFPGPLPSQEDGNLWSCTEGGAPGAPPRHGLSVDKATFSGESWTC